MATSLTGQFFELLAELSSQSFDEAFVIVVTGVPTTAI